MTNKPNLNGLYDQLLNCHVEAEFQSLYQSVMQLDDVSLLKFLTRSRVYQKKIGSSNSEYFWKSGIPVGRASLLFKSEKASEFVFGYFGRDSHCTSVVNESIAGTNPQVFLKVAKISQIFLKSAWYTDLKFMERSGIQELKVAFKEFSFLYLLNQRWERDKQPYLSKLLSYSIETILIQTIAYFEKFKRSSSVLSNNRAALTSYEVTLCYVFSEIISDLRGEAKNYKIPITNTLSIADFNELLKSQLPPLNPPEGLANGAYTPLEEISEEKAELREIIEFYFSRRVYQNHVDKYCSGFADFQVIDGEAAELSSNNNFKLFVRNDYKYKYIENYYANRGQILKQEAEPATDVASWEKQTSLLAYYHQFEALKIGVIGTKLEQKDFLDITELLVELSKWLMPQGRTIILSQVEEKQEGTIMQPETFTKQIPEAFEKLFKPDYLVRIEGHELIEKCATYFKWSEKHVGHILDFLSYDLNKSYLFEVDFLYRPLLKVEGAFYWLSPMLKDRHWANLMHTRIVKDKIIDHNDQSKELEKSMADMFNKAKFTAIPSLKYGDEAGEIDTVVYKDGHILFIELKTTYHTEDLLRESEFNSRALDDKAAGQLDRAIEYYYENFEFFREALRIDKQKEEIVVDSLIVSNIFDWDDLMKGGKHLKTSLLELEIILKNSLYDMLNIQLPGFLTADNTAALRIPVYRVEAPHNSNNPRYKGMPFDCSKENCDLWKADGLSFERFHVALKNHETWKFIDVFWDSDVKEKYELNPYRSDIKRLV